MAKRTKKARLDQYADFWRRTFSDVDVNKILEEGGGLSLESFKDKTRGNTTSNDMRKVMFETVNKKTGAKGNLGREIFKRFFENENITQNKAGRIVVRTGHILNYGGKIQKGGQFVSRDFLARRT